MMDQKTVEECLLSFPNVWKDFPFDKATAVYRVGSKTEAIDGGTDNMFALIVEGKTPVRLSLKCDPGLARLLREKYDEVMPGDHLNQKYWNTLLLTGQLSWKEVQELIRHSYDLVATD